MSIKWVEISSNYLFGGASSGRSDLITLDY